MLARAPWVAGTSVTVGARVVAGTPAGAGAQSSAGAPAAFTIRLTSPTPLYLAGRCRVAAEALDATTGEPSAEVAYMTLSVDDVDQPVDSKTPFAWDFDAGDDLRRRRITITAVGRDGRRASLSVLSSPHPFVESVGVNLVLVPVVVRAGEERNARLLGGMKSDEFTVLEDDVVRPIVSFSNEPVPASIVVALDNSRSMEGNLWSAQKAIAGFLQNQPAWSALSFLVFNDEVFMEHDFTHDAASVASAVSAARAEGSRTALYDALRIASMHLSKRPGARVLVLFTDGEDTVYEADPGRLRTSIETAQSADVTVFAVAYGPRGSSSLAEIASQTGGEIAQARGAGDLRDAFARITESLATRYLIGYEPPNPAKPGYRRIDVRVSRPGAKVFARHGYLMK